MGKTGLVMVTVQGAPLPKSLDACVSLGVFKFPKQSYSQLY